MSNIRSAVTKLIKDLYKYKYVFLKYQLLTRIVTTLLLVPIINSSILLLMGNRGVSSLSNGLITKFIFSPHGLIAILVVFIIAICIILTEIGGMVVISHQAYKGEIISNYFEIIKFSLSKFTKMFGIGGILIALYVLILSPLLGLEMSTSFLNDLKIPGFIMDVIKNNNLYNILLIVATIIGIAISFTLLLTIHYIVLKDKKSFEAVKLSVTKITKNLKLAIKYILTISLITIMIVFLALGILIALSFIFAVSVNSTIISIIMLAFFIFIIGVLSFIAIPMQIHLLTMLFYQLEDCTDINIPQRKKTPRKHLIINTLLVFIFIIGIVCVMGVYLLGMIYSQFDVKITAHRGNSVEAPENTIASIEYAIKAGADYAEIDVQELSDGNIVLIHDKTVARTTNGEGYIWDYDLEEIQKLDAGSWFDSSFSDQTIPTLQEVIDVSGDKIGLNIELKSHKYAKNLVPAVIKIIRDNNFTKKCVVTSLEYELLEEVERLAPEIMTGYIMYAAYGDLNELNVDFYSIEESGLSSNFVAKAHSNGKQVHTWTINNLDNLEDILLTGVDNIITDYVFDAKDRIKSVNQDNKEMSNIINKFLDSIDK